MTTAHSIWLTALLLSAPAVGLGAQDTLAAYLDPEEISYAMGGAGVQPPRPAASRRDTVALLLDAGMWNWEGHGEPDRTLRYYCAALALGITDSLSLITPFMILQSYREGGIGVAIDVLRAAAVRWPKWRRAWQQFIVTYALVGRGAESAPIRKALDEGRPPPIPESQPDGCVRLRRPRDSR